jgi:hypothetical protein
MGRMNVLLLSLLAWLSASAAVVTTTSAPTSRPDSLNSYRLIWTTRNIFNRDRKLPVKAPTTRTSTPKTQEQMVILTGIVVQECGQVAFFEDTRAGETLRVCGGQPLANGVVKSISLDSVEFQTENGIRSIAIGENLAGQANVPTAASSSSEGVASSEPSASMPSGGGGGDVLERMRQRRAQELK